MGAWGYSDNDGRPPPGMTPIGFDADTGVHTYQDPSDGSFWEGEAYGSLRRVGSATQIGTPESSPNADNVDIEGNPAYHTSVFSSYYRRRRDDTWRYLAPFLLLIGLFLLIVYHFMGGTAAIMHNIKNGNTNQVQATNGVQATAEYTSGQVADAAVDVRCNAKINLAPYKSHAGDSCWSVATKYNMELRDLEGINGRELGNKGCQGTLSPGTVLCVRTARW